MPGRRTAAAHTSVPTDDTRRFGRLLHGPNRAAPPALAPASREGRSSPGGTGRTPPRRREAVEPTPGLPTRSRASTQAPRHPGTREPERSKPSQSRRITPGDHDGHPTRSCVRPRRTPTPSGHRLPSHPRARAVRFRTEWPARTRTSGDPRPRVRGTSAPKARDARLRGGTSRAAVGAEIDHGWSVGRTHEHGALYGSPALGGRVRSFRAVCEHAFAHLGTGGSSPSFAWMCGTPPRSCAPCSS